MFLANVYLHGGPAPALPDILPVRALKESESAVDNRSMFSTTYLPITAFSSVCVTTFCAVVSRAHVSHTWPAVITISVNNGVFGQCFVAACAAERCFIRSELLTTDVDKGN